MTKKKLGEKEELVKDEGTRMVLAIFWLIIILSNAFLSVLSGNRVYFYISCLIVMILGPKLFNKMF